MASQHAFDIIYSGCKLQLIADGNTTPVLFGKRELAKRINKEVGVFRRVVFVPGDDKGAIGEYGPATKVRLPAFQGNVATRTLYTLTEVFRVYCFAFDASAPEDELAQYAAARYLHDQVVRALHLSSHGNFTLDKPMIVPQPTERKFGCEIMITLNVIARIPDDPGPVEDPDFETVKPTTGVGPTRLASEGEAPEDGEADGSDTTSGE